MTTLIASDTLPGGKHWSMMLWRNSRLKLTDVEGGANVGMLFYNPLNLLERYNAPDTLKCQHTFKLTQGHCLYSDMGRIFCSIVSDTSGWHDTVCGNTTKAAVAEQMGRERATRRNRNDWQQNGHDSFLVEAAKYGLGRRDLAANVNWFSKVVVADDGAHGARCERRQGRRVRRAPLRDGHARPLPHLSASAEHGADLSAQARALRDSRRPARDRRRSPTASRRRRTCAASRTTASSTSAAARARNDDHGKPTRSRRRALPQGRAGRRVLDPRRAQGRDAAHRRPRRQSGRRHAVLQRRRSRRALFGVRHHSRAGQHLSQHRHGPSVRSLPADADHHRRHRRPPRHARRRLLDREQHRPLRARQEVDARLPRQLPARGRRERPLRAHQARHRPQHQFLHERAGDAGRRTCSSPTVSRRRANMSRWSPR